MLTPRPLLWLFVLLASLLCACQGPGPAPAMDPPTAPDLQQLRIVAEPALTPLMERLVPSFRERTGTTNLQLEPALSAPGALRALRDERIQAAVVFRLADEPAPTHGQRFAYTRALWIAGPGLRLRHLNAAQLARAMRGELVDAEGQTIRLSLSDVHDARLRAFTGSDPQLQAALPHVRYTGRLEEGHSQRPLPHHLSLSDTGLVSLLGIPAWPVRYAQTMAPLELWIVHGPQPPPQVLRLVDFLRSAGGQEHVRELGYDLPLVGP